LRVRILILLSFVFYTLSGCKKDTLYTEEIMEIYEVVKQGNEDVIGNVIFSESEVFDPSGALYNKIYYNADKSIKGVEAYEYQDGEELSHRSSFRDATDSLLSYYTFVYKDDGKLLRKIAFDATDDTVLRIEEYAYNKKGERTLRYTKSADNQVVSEYRFSFDEDGNEIAMILMDGAGNTRRSDSYTITERDKDGKWLEKWGLENGKPARYYIKSKRILRQKKEEE